MQKSTFIVASLLFAVAGYAGIACSASARGTGFDDPDDGAGGKGSGNGAGGLDFTSGNTGTGGGVLGTEPACDGVDPNIDNDADGWTGSNGDCNDCTALMNPGALDFPGNNIDEDCNAAKDDNPGSCDGALPLNASNAVVSGCQILDNEHGIRIWEKRGTISGSTISGNGFAVSAQKDITISTSTISGNDWGVNSDRKATVTDSTISDTSNAGLESRKVRITNSTVQNSGTDCSEHPLYCFDIGSQGRPRALEVVCGSSARIARPPADEFPTGEDWDLCSND